MSTSLASLDRTQYVKVNVGHNPILLQSPRDAVRIVFSAVKPALSNDTFHILQHDEDMNIPYNDADVWALSTSDTCSLVVTEFEEGSVPSTVVNTSEEEVPTSDRSMLSSSQSVTDLLSQLLLEQKLSNLYLSRIVGENLRIDNEQEMS